MSKANVRSPILAKAHVWDLYFSNFLNLETVVGGEADGISVRIDPDVLDCSICFEPLQPPLYQVANPV